MTQYSVSKSPNTSCSMLIVCCSTTVEFLILSVSTQMIYLYSYLYSWLHHFHTVIHCQSTVQGVTPPSPDTCWCWLQPHSLTPSWIIPSFLLLPWLVHSQTGSHSHWAVCWLLWSSTQVTLEQDPAHTVSMSWILQERCKNKHLIFNCPSPSFWLLLFVYVITAFLAASSGVKALFCFSITAVFLQRFSFCFSVWF